ESAYLNSGLKIILVDERKEKETRKELSYDGGIKSFVTDLSKKKKPITDMIYLKESTKDCYIEIAMQYNKGYSSKILSFVNNINTINGGYHVTGFKTALTRAINNVAENKDLLPKKIDKLSGQDIRDGITAIINIRIPEPQFEGQTKTKLGNNEVRKKVETPFYNYLLKYFSGNIKDLKSVVNKAVESIKARMASEKAREMARKSDKLVSRILPSKLADCSTRRSKGTEIYFVEGDSAGGSAKQGRDRNFQAILPLKGKILNVERKELSTMIKNTEIASIVTALGTGVGKSFDIKKLRYEKIIIMTDADIDGAHIRTLLLTFFYRYMRPLLEKGYIYIAQPPLYKVKKGRKEEYLYDDRALKKFITEHGKENISLQRYKGLGEMNPDQLWETTMNPDKRVVLRVQIEDAILVDETFTTLMGDKVEPRRNFIQNHADEVENLDV
ncbi:MAG: toprim domain-containing protein, partial [Halanaerobiaceae bacterium]